VRRAHLLLACALVFSSTACASVWRQYDVAPNGLPRGEARLRDWLAQGRADSAFALLTHGQVGPGDDLLRSLFLGATAYYAGDYTRSAAWLDYADYLSEERATKSLSRAALSLVSNDLILPYEPSRTERLFIPYYAALGRLQARDIQGAAVEARRLSALLERYNADDVSGDGGLRATLRYFAAAVFEVAGERNNALVAYRNAAALAPTLVDEADSTFAGGSPHATNGDSSRESWGDVVVFIERGYVAHRAGESLHILLNPQELHTFREADADRRSALASLIAARLIENRPYTPAEQARYCYALGSCLSGQEKHSLSTDTEQRDRDDDDDVPYLLKIAWPVMRRTFDARPLAVRVGDDTLPVHDLGDVSGAVIADFDSDRTMILARTLARGALKAAVAKGAEKKAKEKDETAGRMLGVLANAGSVLLEQADTRSWHLLPSRLSVVRLRLTPGVQPLAVTVGGTSIDLGIVDVPTRSVAVLATRVW
jgi:hypothetical protein